LEDKDFSFPVGRAEVMNLGPLTFSEYLLTRKQPALVALLRNVQTGEEISEAVHERLLTFVREFMNVGPPGLHL